VSVFKEVAKPIYFPPVLLKFKTKTLSVEAVGVEDGGFLGVPSSWHTAGWYAEGAKPGEEGNVILDGHYDTNTGAPGAFWELKAVQIGDTVVLTDKLGRDFYYQVTSKSFISITDPDRAQVFASGKEKVLTLITCGGMWDYASGTYNKRLVITAVFAKMEKKW
jgi:LPXTG-site transpeptidase (sortase) family protein